MKISLELHSRCHADARILQTLAAAILAAPDIQGPAFFNTGESSGPITTLEELGAGLWQPSADGNNFERTVTAVDGQLGTGPADPAAYPEPPPGFAPAAAAADSPVAGLSPNMELAMANTINDDEDAGGVQAGGDFDNWGVKHDPNIHSSSKKLYGPSEGKNAGKFHKKRGVHGASYDAAYAGRTNLATGTAAPTTAPGNPAPAAPVYAPAPQAAPPAPQPVPAPAGHVPQPAAAPVTMDFNGFMAFVSALFSRTVNPFPAQEINAVLKANGINSIPEVAGPAATNPNLVPNLVMQLQMRDAQLFPAVA